MPARRNKSDIVFQEVRNRILLNKLKPGDAIGEVALTQEFGVSRTPVRQALQRLAALGLVEIRDGAGTFVTTVDPQDMRYAYEVRCALEKLALETCMEHIEPEELDALDARFRAFLNQLESGGEHAAFEEMAFAEWELHDLIVDRSENHLIAPAVQALTAILRRYQITYISGYLRAAREHIELIGRMRDRDVEGAQAIIDQHLKARTTWHPAQEA